MDPELRAATSHRFEPLVAGLRSGPRWHTPHPEGAARRIADRVLAQAAPAPF